MEPWTYLSIHEMEPREMESREMEQSTSHYQM